MSRSIEARRNLECFLGLTVEESVFCIEYVKDMAPRRAAEAAGLDPEEGARVLARKHVKAAISRVMADRLDHVLVDKEWVMNELRDNHYIARQQGNIAASNKALDQVAKHTDVDAYAADKVEHSGDMGLSIVVKTYGEVIEGEIVPDKQLHDAKEGASHPGAELLFQVPEPFLAPFRRLVPNLGGLDLSPILLFVVINILEAAVIRGPARSMGMSSTVAQFFVGIS